MGGERLGPSSFEVATAARGRGVGMRVVRSLMERRPYRRLLPTARAPTAPGLRWAGSRSSIPPAVIGRCSSSRLAV